MSSTMAIMKNTKNRIEAGVTTMNVSQGGNVKQLPLVVTFRLLGEMHRYSPRETEREVKR